MADTSSQADIRGIKIDKMAKDYMNENLIFKNLVKTVSTESREIRWYQKTSGYLSHTSPASFNVAPGARPFVLETSWTRNTSYTKKWFVESPWIRLEDISDSEVKVYDDNLQDLIGGVSYSLDAHIWDVASESQSPSNINSVTSTAAWDAASGQNPIADINEAKRKIRQETKRKLNNGVLLLNATGEESLINWLVSIGAQIPGLASALAGSGKLMEISGLSIVVSENVTADYAMVGALSEAVEYYEYIPLNTAILNEEGIGKKIRVWTAGVAVLVKPKYLALISNIDA